MNKYPTYPPKLFITIYEHASPCTTTSTTPRYAKQSWPRLGFPPSYFLCQPTESHLFSWDTDHHNLHREQKLGYDHSRCRFSEFEIRKLGNRPVQWDWMEKCLFGASYRRWRFPESLWLKCQSLHFEQLAKKHPSFSQLYCQIFFGLAFPIQWQWLSWLLIIFREVESTERRTRLEMKHAATQLFSSICYCIYIYILHALTWCLTPLGKFLITLSATTAQNPLPPVSTSRPNKSKLIDRFLVFRNHLQFCCGRSPACRKMSTTTQQRIVMSLSTCWKANKRNKHMGWASESCKNGSCQAATGI